MMRKPKKNQPFVTRQYAISGGVNYPDTGCAKAKMQNYHGKCINCPFPQCLEDAPRAIRQEKNGSRNREIRRLYESGKTIPELARQFKLSERQIARVIDR